ncbi:nitrogenase iron-molybdenum cofactor biosynthesis protein NifE [Magnetospirillum sp. UT-4]|uniref:nitrogenase iron-molybdenum cofactor biosynthesis protein NifE n=1 Tax=Magnetospirillum sp. UT-4 TaxID=2681467 RepID=UPI0013813DA2|nr:nitrogenase iron-molybdenum cofactor biosynthesis protein NifE [Magnetospirillum sp. UT-4]CAA7615292.1 Nitrogenase iron-molybdenum cofactor biosynthesis protein NifE [Magnetospirillum sp. UT-4]
MLKHKIAELMNEPGCATNQAKSDKDRKKGCGKQLTPGAAAGGCAFDGAKIALQPITDVVHLVHGPIACEGNSWDGRNSWSTGSTLYRLGFTTDMQNLDIVNGGEKKLYKAIKRAIARHNPPAVFVYQTCVGALIGDDVDAVCKAATERLGVPVVPVNAPGFVGSKNLGNRLGGEALFEHVIGTHEPDDVGPTDINILGEYNVAGELDQFRPLLARLGIRLRCSITGDARYLDVASSHTAKANMVLCSQALITLARKMKETWGIPYFEGSFYGISDTSDALRNIARMLVEQGADATLSQRTEALIAEQEALAWARLAAYKPRLAGRKVLLYTGGVKSWSVIQALQEVGMEVVGSSVRKATEADKKKALERLGGDEDKLADAITPKDMYAMFKDGKADMMLSGGRSQFIALKARTPWLDINQERHHGYACYDGMVELVRQIDLMINNPVWDQVRKPAPWEEA